MNQKQTTLVQFPVVQSDRNINMDILTCSLSKTNKKKKTNNILFRRIVITSLNSKLQQVRVLQREPPRRKQKL